MAAANRQLTISPYVPDRTESLGTNANTFAQADIGKFVKYADAAMVLCADGEDIVGVITAVEPYTKNGFTIGSVKSDVGTEAWAIDEASGLGVGDLVFCGTAIALGTANAANGPNVKNEASVAATNLHKWQVVAIYGDGSAGDQVLIRKV